MNRDPIPRMSGREVIIRGEREESTEKKLSKNLPRRFDAEKRLLRFLGRQAISGRGGIRTHTPVTQEGILSPVQSCENHGFSGTSVREGAVEGAVGTKIDPNLQRLIDAWPTLQPALRDCILSMIEAARKSR